MRLRSLLLLLCLHLNVVVFGQEGCEEEEEHEDDQCGGPLSDIEFDDILDLCAYHARCTQPTRKLNANCILSSCPMLKGVCPMDSAGCVNETALTKAVSLLNACIGQEGLVCGINLTRTPMVQIGWTTKNILPVNVVNGSVNLNPGSGFLDNLSKTNFTLVQTDNPTGPISIYIRSPYLICTCNFSCTFNLSENSFLRSLKRQLTTSGIPNAINISDMMGVYTNNIATVVSFDLATPTPAISILDDQSDINIFYSNFDGLNNMCLPQPLVDTFNRAMQNYVSTSVITSTAINFLSTYAALGLKAAQLNCP